MVQYNNTWEKDWIARKGARLPDGGARLPDGYINAKNTVYPRLNEFLFQSPGQIDSRLSRSFTARASQLGGSLLGIPPGFWPFGTLPNSLSPLLHVIRSEDVVFL